MTNKLIIILFLSFIILIAAEGETEENFLWNRWEPRTIDCVSSGKKDECILLSPKSLYNPETKKANCRREPMPQSDWNPLAKNSTTRLACPISCTPNFDLSVLQKVPYVNKNCQKYYTYGKYRDTKENEWYIWMTEPCVAAISTHCRYNDVPLQYKGEKNAENEEKLSKPTAQNTKESEQRKKVVAA